MLSELQDSECLEDIICEGKSGKIRSQKELYYQVCLYTQGIWFTLYFDSSDSLLTISNSVTTCQLIIIHL